MSVVPDNNLKLINETGQSMVEILRGLRDKKIDRKEAREMSRVASQAIASLGQVYIEQTKAAAKAENTKSYKKMSEAALINAQVRQEQHEAKKESSKS